MFYLVDCCHQWMWKLLGHIAQQNGMLFCCECPFAYFYCSIESNNFFVFILSDHSMLSIGYSGSVVVGAVFTVILALWFCVVVCCCVVSVCWGPHVVSDCHVVPLFFFSH